MSICYLCGIFMREDTEGKGGIDCQKCHVHYCEDCSSMVKSCYSCGTALDTSKLTGHLSLPQEAVHFAEPKRRYIRKEFFATIEYFPSLPPNARQAFKGITNNISASGLCMFTMDLLSEGQVIYFPRSFRLGNHTSAVVRWVKKVSDRMYTAGLMFQEHPQE